MLNTMNPGRLVLWSMLAVFTAPVVTGAQENKAQKAPSPAACQSSALWCVQRAPHPARTDYVRDEVLLFHDRSKPENFSESVMRQFNLREKSNSKLYTINQTLITADTNGRNPLELVAAIKQQQQAVGASANNLFFTTAAEATGPQRERATYPLAATGIQTAHKFTKGKGVKICMIDTAIDINHRSLDNQHVQHVLLGGGNGASNQQHGTEVAGVIISQNPRIGIAPEANLLAISTFAIDEKTGKRISSAKLILQALDLCVRDNADIINLSFAGGRDVLVDKMIRKAIANGIVVVASAGNNGPGARPAYPAAIPDVIAVTAVDQAENIFGQANRGSYIDLAAPGVDILTTSPRGSFNLASGTSLATAHVTGIIALLMSMNRQGFRSSLLDKTAIDLGRSGRDNDFGYGLVNIERALQLNKLD